MNELFGAEPLRDASCEMPSCDRPKATGSRYCSTHVAKLRPKASGTAQMVCPHCQMAGRVTRKTVKVKSGLSGGKATGAVLTGGISLFATGLSRKVTVTEARCGNCGTTWHIS